MAQNACHGITGCLATGQRNLHFMIEYFKNENVYKLPNRHVHSLRPPGNVTQFWGK